jgi:hypothetical protein
MRTNPKLENLKDNTKQARNRYSGCISFKRLKLLYGNLRLNHIKEGAHKIR